MPKDNKKYEGVQVLVTVAAFVIVVAGMRAAEGILVPFLLSAFLAIICAPPLFWLRRNHVPTVLALLIVIGGIMGIGLLMGVLIGSSLNDFSASLPIYQARLQEETAAVLTWLAGMGVRISEGILREYFDPGAVMRLVASTLTRLGGVLTNAFLILLTVIFILLEASSFPTKLRVILGGSNQSLANMDRVVDDVKRYMARKTLVSLGTGIAIAIWLAILGVDYPLLWGLLAFFLNFVPNIGSIIAALPAILLAFVQLGVSSALLAGLGFLVVNLVIGNVIEPRFMGRGLGLSTLVVFISLVFWGWVLGPVGMLLSVPLTMTVKIALESNEDTRWIAILLGSEASAKAASAVPLKVSRTEPSDTRHPTSPPSDSP
ncbi:MAG: AI-2E family transporter [Proteobacteria bacterium]|nr:AI-2E family transporter [Pseudomonadota bacterium]NIS69120.1 AI-2E family transporter [Pseudomonadota bacterium]